ncbi:MAG: radical SAM protein, partial [Chloroflexi bacterium]|nr:radical SAM protein [Chloroflexota bacterium]
CVGMSLDAACDGVYREIKGGSWDKAINLLRDAVQEFPGRITTHLIVGLGETEREMVETLQLMADWGVTVGLFAFTPVRGTRMQKNTPPPIEVYRRVQVAHYLIRKRLSHVRWFTFDQKQRITGFGFKPRHLHSVLADGEAFRTSGCEGCNRPYYNERPGSVMYNYPRPLTPEEVLLAITQVKTPVREE